MNQQNVPFSTTYNSAKYTNPGDYIDPKVKQSKEEASKLWFRRKMEYMYSCYLRDDAYIPYSYVRDYFINRLYGQGRQPNTKYLDVLTVLDRQSGKRKGWMNISWDIVPILVKFRSVVLGKFEDLDYVPTAMAVDDFSSTEREDIKWTSFVNAKYEQELTTFRAALGMEDPQMKLPFTPRNAEELDMLASLGFFKLSWEVTMGRLMNSTAQTCNWAQLKRRLLEDAIDLGVIAVKDYQDPINGKPMVRYVDPANLIIRQTRMNDYSDVTEAAEITWYSIADLRAYGLSDAELVEAAQSYAGIYGNPHLSEIPYSAQDRYRHDAFKVAVLDGDFESFDSYFYESRSIGEKEISFDLPFDSKKGTSKKNKFQRKQYEKRYRAKWVIGTPVVFDYGLQYDMPYDQEMKPKSSYTCYRISDRSLISQCISVADDVQIAILKLRAAVAEGKPAGVMIEFGSLKDIAMGGEKLSPFDILKIYRDRGDLLFRYALAQNGQPLQGGIPPITELRGGIGPYLQELMTTLEFSINMIREITGINQVADASTPQPGALVGVAQIAESSTLNVLKPILTGYKSVKQRAFANICQRWQLTGMFYPQSMPFSNGDGNAMVDIIKVSKDLYRPVFDVFVDMPIKDADRAELMQACLASMQAAKTGSIGITMQDFVIIKRMMADGNMGGAWIYLAYREEKMQQDRDATAGQMQQQNAQMQQQAIQMQQEGAMATIVATEEEKRKTLSLDYYYQFLLKSMDGGAIPPQGQQLEVFMPQPPPPPQAPPQQGMPQEQMAQEQGVPAQQPGMM